MKKRLYRNAVALTDMDRRQALSAVGFKDETDGHSLGLERLSGRMVNDALFGKDNRYPDLRLFERDPPNTSEPHRWDRAIDLYAVSGLPFASAAFTFVLWGVREKRKVAERPVFTVKRASWQPPRMTRPAVEILLGELLNMHDKRACDGFFSAGGWTDDRGYRSGTREFKEKEYVFSKAHVASRIFVVRKKSDVLRSDAWRLLSAHADFAFLCHGSQTHEPIYPLKLVLKMKHLDIEILIANLKARPLEQAFDATIESYWSGGYKGALVKVPEISLQSLERLSLGHPDAREWWLAAAKIYRGLKIETWKERNCVTPESDIVRFVADHTLRMAGLEWLLARKILKASSRGLIMSEINEWEVCLKESMEKIMSEPYPPTTKFGNSDNLLTRDGHQLCDEQKKAFRVLSNNPFLLVDGKAGSGKTDFLAAVASTVALDEILATAYQGTNAGDLAKIFPGRAFTTHKIIYHHANRCPGLKKKHKKDGPWKKEEEEAVCPLQGVKVLVVDELGTQSLDVFSKLLSAVSVCGQVEKVVLTGDSGQLPPINPGDVLLSLRSFLGDRGMYVRFNHNHRQARGAKLLARNADAISAGKMVKFDEKNCVHVKQGVDESAADAVVRILERWEIDEYEHNVVVRTNELRTKIIPRIEKLYLGGDPPARSGMLVDRKMSFTQNDYEREIVNNEILRIDQIRDVGGARDGSRNFTGGAVSAGATRTVEATSLGGRLVRIEWDEWAKTHSRKASCTTVNVFQGSQIAWIIYVMPYFCQYETRERVYTTFTRPTKGIFFVGKLEDLERAVKNPEKRKRSDLVAKLEEIPEDCKMPGLEPVKSEKRKRA